MYLEHLKTPQSAPLAGQVKNSAGGYVYETSIWTQLDRFLILGSEGGSYYAGERELTIGNRSTVEFCLAKDGPRTVRRIVEISVLGRAPKNEPATMALVTAASEPEHAIVGFSANPTYNPSRSNVLVRRNDPRNSGLAPLGISAKDRLDTVVKTMAGFNWGGTDCALPMLWAAANKVQVDTFQVYTDNETFHGDVHPSRALKEYRQKMGRDAKLVVIGLTATSFSVADPADSGSLDIVGFDSAAPAIIADFARS